MSNLPKRSHSNGITMVKQMDQFSTALDKHGLVRMKITEKL